MLTKIDDRLWFTVFADFWMVRFLTKRTVRVVTQKQFVSSIAHFNTFYFRGKFLKFWILNFQTLALMCHFFVHTVVPVQGRSHEQKFRITIATRTFGVTKTTLVCQLKNGAGREYKKQRRSCARPDAAHLLMSSSRLDDGTQTNAFQLSFPRSPLYRQSHKCSETRAVVKLSC